MSNAHAPTADLHSHGNEHKVNYILIFFTLVILTFVTVLIAMKRFDNEAVNVLLALLVATIKATFVARFFMHLKFEGKLIWSIFVVPLCLTVLIIFALIPDVGHGIHKVQHVPPQLLEHDAKISDHNHY
jgi:caa(3)-type oxidase subunit IV